LLDRPPNYRWSPNMPELKPGDPAPTFKVKDHAGNEHTLAQAKGKTLILWFYPAASTPG
jgi:thioredoxin-dependent peroxiredoxin